MSKGYGSAPNASRTLSGKVHATPSGHEPGGTRNRVRRYRAKCGAVLTWAWPFEVTPVNACRKCYPDVAAPRFPDL